MPVFPGCQLELQVICFGGNPLPKEKKNDKCASLTLVQCVGPAPTGGSNSVKPPIPELVNAYHLATLTLHGWRLGPSRRTSLFLFLCWNHICSKTSIDKSFIQI